MPDNKFYLGRRFDLATSKLSDQPLLYDPADLTTHAVVTGMTGSGKTGLCIALLEEAALQGIPALMIDPKGDLTNLLLHFPDLAPQDFQPWLDPEMARRAGQTLEGVAAQAAQAWRNGLSEWGLDRERLLALKNAAQFAVYTPGSDAGIPVSVLTSLHAPPIPSTSLGTGPSTSFPGLAWEGNRDVLRAQIVSTVTALLGLVGMGEMDPLRSREHILLSNIFENAWSRAKSLDMAELILQTQNPPFDKLGAFPMDTFFPAKDRMGLALQLNNILAAPAFEIWRQGQSLDIAALLSMPDGRPRHSVFYLAHLSDSERMFFVTLLLSAVETWMRTQAGATSLRALLYMDEIYGYLPPQSNPPSKQPLLRMLKQARAFGLGLLLATQNPVDLDYKALSNAGSWFIGKLQTDQDKQRLLDGLESAASGSLDRRAYDKLISGLGKRIFLLHNIHTPPSTSRGGAGSGGAVIFHTRWTMNFLAGPLTPPQIPALNKLVGADYQPSVGGQQSPFPPVTPAPDPSAIASGQILESVSPITVPQPAVNSQSSIANRKSEISSQSSITRPSVPTGVSEYFLPVNLSLPEAFNAAGKSTPEEAMLSGMLYRPALAAAAQVRFLDRKYGVNAETGKAALVIAPDKRGVVRWDDFLAHLPPDDKMDPSAAPGSRFAALDAPLSDARLMANLQRDFADWAFRTSKLTVRANEALGLYATPDVSQAEFMKACAEAARQQRDAEITRATATIDRQIKTLQDKIAREKRELKMDEAELSARKVEELGTHAENLLGVFSGRRASRRLSTSLTKHRLTEQAKEEVDESVEAIQAYQQQLTQLEQARQQALGESSSKWGDVVNDITEITLTPKKMDVYVNLFGVAWMPYYLLQSGNETIELPAFGKS
ncbi:MAG: DUF87 domain-containing protein [Anaerolineales bacterium]|nr:DUF87 domain-containing protein [Anaerolineales bacterium]